MTNPFHADLLGLIQQQAGEPRTSALHGNYMGNTHTFYAIRAPQLRAIAKAWMSQHRDLGPEQLDSLVTSLVEAPSSTEKILAGVLFDYARKEQRAINPKRFDEWLNHVEGWAETDALCTNKYTITQLPPDWKQWEKQLPRFAVSKQIQKRRASLVFLCAPLRKFREKHFLEMSLDNVQLLKQEKDILTTKAVSWVLRSAVKHHKPAIAKFIREHQLTLPAIAIRETRKVIETGRK